MAEFMATAAAQEDGNVHAFSSAFVMIVVSEIGDKTFLIAAIMATRHPRITVFAGAFASLVVMSVLSAALGKFLLGLIPKVWTLWAAAVLFLVFGVKMVQEAMHMSSSHLADEMREAEEELEEDSSLHDASNPQNGVALEILEEGRVSRGPLENTLSARTNSPAASTSRSASPRPTARGRQPSISLGAGVGPLKDASLLTRMRESSRNLIQMMTSPVFAQAFVLTFLGEWGDRSQITTIAMAGAHSVPVIAFGTIVGHSLCTFIAVMGGRFLSTKLSIKHTFAFLVFSVMYAYEAYHTPSEIVATI